VVVIVVLLVCVYVCVCVCECACICDGSKISRNMATIVKSIKLNYEILLSVQSKLA
jgi:hypothetical protein